MDKFIFTIQPLTQFAEFDCGSYGAGQYDVKQQCEGDLANTGYDILVPLALGAAIIIASIILLVKRFRRSKKS